MLWPLNYNAGRGFHPLAGDNLKVWDGAGKVYEGKIVEARSFLYSTHGEVKMALGGIAEEAMPYLQGRPTSGWCIAVRSELADAPEESCPIEGEERSWTRLN
jgi:hypothetical protein